MLILQRPFQFAYDIREETYETAEAVERYSGAAPAAAAGGCSAAIFDWLRLPAEAVRATGTCPSPGAAAAIIIAYATVAGRAARRRPPAANRLND